MGYDQASPDPLDFPDGTVMLTEQSTKKRASLHVVQGAGGLAEIDPGGIEVRDKLVALGRAGGCIHVVDGVHAGGV